MSTEFQKLLEGGKKTRPRSKSKSKPKKNSHHNSSTATGGAIPEAGRSIKKLDMDELPWTFSKEMKLDHIDLDPSLLPNVNPSDLQDFEINEHRYRPHKKPQQQQQQATRTPYNPPGVKNSGKPPKSRGASFENYDLLSKFDASVFNPDTKLTQKAMTRLKADLNNKSFSNRTLNSNTNTHSNAKSSTNLDPAKQLHRLKNKVVGNVESDLGFGFDYKSNFDMNQHQTQAQISSGGGVAHRGQRSGHSSRKSDMKIGAENPQKAMKAAARKTKASIQELSKKIGRKKEEWKTEEFGWDGYHYQGGGANLKSQTAGVDFTGQTHNAPANRNQKLSEMSNKFKNSLKVNTDVKRAIKTPQNVDADVGVNFSNDFDEQDRDSSFSNSIEGSMSKSALLTRSSALYVPLKKTDVSQRHKRKSAKMHDERSKPVGGRETDTENEFEEESATNNSTDFAGLMKLRNLLESKPPGEKSYRKEKTGHIDFSDLKQATSSLASSSAGKKSYKFKDASVEKLDMGTSPYSPSGGEVRIMSENYYAPSAPKTAGSVSSSGHRLDIPVDEFIKQQLGESVKTVDDASVIAHRLGSLMTKVAMSRTNNDSNNNNNNNKNGVDTVGLARELRELASSMEKDYGKNYPSASSTSLGAGQAAETQTDRECSSKNLPQPKFTKQMSYTDQLVLRKLREIREKWRSEIRVEEQTVGNQ